MLSTFTHILDRLLCNEYLKSANEICVKLYIKTFIIESSQLLQQEEQKNLES